MDENPDPLDDWARKASWWAEDPDGEGEAERIEGEYVSVMVKSTASGRSSPPPEHPSVE